MLIKCKCLRFAHLLKNKYMTEVERLELIIEGLSKKIKILQNKCKHKEVNYMHRGDTGNYDRSLDGYWTEFTCKVCHRWWIEDGTKYKPDYLFRNI